MTSRSGRPGPAGEPTRWIRSERALFRRLPDGVVVLVLPDGEPELVTGPGGLLWDLLGSPRTLDELTDELAARYDHDRAVVRRDLEPTLDGLRTRQLIVADR